VIGYPSFSALLLCYLWLLTLNWVLSTDFQTNYTLLKRKIDLPKRTPTHTSVVILIWNKSYLFWNLDYNSNVVMEMHGGKFYWVFF
jgi:hypothetical protein